MAGRRPGGVTLVAVLAWISGILSVIGGIIAVASGLGGPVGIAGWISIIIGVITILVGIGLLRGSNGARVVATIVFVLNLVSAIFAMFSSPGQFWTSLVSALLAVIGLVLLYSKAANDFFRP